MAVWRRHLISGVVAAILGGGWALLDRTPETLSYQPSGRADEVLLCVYDMEDLVQQQMAFSRGVEADRPPSKAHRDAEIALLHFATEIVSGVPDGDGVYLFDHRLVVRASRATHDRLNRIFTLMGRSS